MRKRLFLDSKKGPADTCRLILLQQQCRKKYKKGSNLQKKPNQTIFVSIPLYKSFQIFFLKLKYNEAGMCHKIPRMCYWVKKKQVHYALHLQLLKLVLLTGKSGICKWACESGNGHGFPAMP